MRLDAFQGLWQLHRRVEDMRARRTGRLRGTARFDPGPGGLACLEEGLLELGGGRFPASRRYVWRDGGMGTIEVLFEDGRFFHRFCADETRPAAAHLCGRDHYRVRYDFAHWPRWEAEWRVRGPAKDYVLVSSYRPAGQAGETAA